MSKAQLRVFVNTARAVVFVRVERRRKTPLTRYTPATNRGTVEESGHDDPSPHDLKPFPALEKTRALAELWHWRSRTRQMVETGKVPALPPNVTLSDIIREAAKAAHHAGDIAAPTDEDFTAHGRPYRDLSAEEFSTMTSIAMERHKAMNWLCGKAPGHQWDKHQPTPDGWRRLATSQ